MYTISTELNLCVTNWPQKCIAVSHNFFIHLHTTVGPCAVLKRKPVVGIVGALLSSSAAYCTPTPPPSRPLETRKLSLGAAAASRTRMTK